MKLPEITIRTLAVAHDRCAICGRDREPGSVPVPSAYTVESIRDESVRPPHVVCDRCVEEYYPGVPGACPRPAAILGRLTSHWPMRVCDSV